MLNTQYTELELMKLLNEYCPVINGVRTIPFRKKDKSLSVSEKTQFRQIEAYGYMPYYLITDNCDVISFADGYPIALFGDTINDGMTDRVDLISKSGQKKHVHVARLGACVYEAEGFWDYQDDLRKSAVNGNRPNGLKREGRKIWVRHRDGNSHNNHVTNLYFSLYPPTKVKEKIGIQNQLCFNTPEECLMAVVYGSDMKLF